MQAGSRAAISTWLHRCVASFALVGLCLLTAVATAQDLVHVEEDWQLVIAQPDSNSCGPQIACTMSPLPGIDQTYFTLEINHRSEPYWTPGGITLHQWFGEARLQSMDRPDRSVMSTAEEVVTWTQSLDTHGNVLTFK